MQVTSSSIMSGKASSKKAAPAKEAAPASPVLLVSCRFAPALSQGVNGGYAWGEFIANDHCSYLYHVNFLLYS